MAAIKLYYNINQLLSMKGVSSKQGRFPQKKDLSIIKNAAMVVEKSKIVWIGKESKLPEKYKKVKRVDAQAMNLFPGFIDCHTHLIFAGDRRHEFEERVNGASYQQIAARGGGILSTVRATRKASEEHLVELGQHRVDNYLKQGVTTLEVKSGYGLNSKAEQKMLRAALELKKANVMTSFLGAHAIPKNFTSDRAYLEKLKKDLMEIKKQSLSKRVDIFIEKNYFSLKAAKDYLSFAKELGFEICVHADQLSRTGATRLAVELGARSADHAINLSSSDVKALAQSDTVAVLLPGADFYLKCAYPEARKLIDAGGRVAVASDFNPGSCPTQNIAFIGLLARLEMRMTLPEVFTAMTYNAALALGKESQLGSLEVGKQADFFFSKNTYDQMFFDLNAMPVEETYVKGKRVFKA